jgi:hypothetical protein
MSTFLARNKAGGKFSEAVRHTGGLKREKSTRTSAATSVTQDRNFSWLGHTHTRDGVKLYHNRMCDGKIATYKI